MSTIAFTGRLAFEPELRFTPSGIAVADLVVLENHRVKKGEEWVDGTPNRHRVKVWRHQAENVAETLKVGDEVVVIGTMRTDEWEDNEGLSRVK